MKRAGAFAVALLVLCASSADAACSASATAAWKAKCPSRTTGNRDFLPLTDMSSNAINVDDSNLVDTYNQARLTALKLSGAVGSAAMDGMRKKSRAWYETSLRKLMTFLCVETSTNDELQRCVPLSSGSAERNASGNCVILTDAGNCHSKGLCERESNCKWDDALPTVTPRRQLFTDANVTAANKWMNQEYPTTFAPFLAPGIFFSVATALTAVGFIVLRCVFNQCGGRNPQEKGYTRCDILIPSVIFLVCSTAVFICSFITIAQNTNISEGVIGVLHSLNVTLENIDIFASNLKTPLALADQQLASAKITVNAQVKDLTWVAADGATLQQMVADFGAYYTTRGPFPMTTCDRTANAWCVPCPDAVCGSPVQKFVANASSAFSASGALVAASIATMQKAFVSDSDSISLSLKTATREIGELANLTRSSKDVVELIDATVNEYSFSRSALVLSVFLFGVFSSLVGVAAIFKGVCKRKTAWVHMLHVSWIVGVLVCILGFVLAASLLAVGALWYDSCNYMNILHSDLSPYFPSGVSKIVNACFADSGILSPLQVENALSFQCDLSDQYAGIANADFGAMPTLIAAIGSRISSFGLRDFGYDSNAWKDIRDKANAAIDSAGAAGSTSFTKDNILKPWTVYGLVEAGGNCTNATADNQPICFMEAKCAAGTVASSTTKAACKDTFTTAYYYQLAYAKVAVLLNEMRQDMLGDAGAEFSSGWKYDTSIIEFAQDYFNRLATVRTQSLDYLMKGEVGRVLETVERARCTESCGWINISFNAVHEALCTDILGTTLAISLCVFFLCIFMVPLIVTGITLHKRLRGIKKGTYDELEKRLQQLESKQREEARTKKAATSPIHGDAKKGASGGIELFKFKKNLDSA
jgi:hypothetical protein